MSKARQRNERIGVPPDVAEFLGWLAGLFGRKTNALTFLIRSTPEFATWRAKVEWCPGCKRFVPIVESAHSKHPYNVVYVDHVHAGTQQRCYKSGNGTKWIGDLTVNVKQPSRDYILGLAKAAKPDPLTGHL